MCTHSAYISLYILTKLKHSETKNIFHQSQAWSISIWKYRKYTIALSLSGITLTSQFTSIHECLFMEANSKRDIWEIKKKHISFSCDTKFSQIFPKYQRLELFFENILVLFLDAIGSLPPIPGLQYTCHTDICHPDWTSGSPFVTHRYFLIFILYVSLGVQSIFLWDGVRLPEKVHTYRVVFWLVPPRKVLS